MKKPTTHFQSSACQTLCAALLISGLMSACSSSDDDAMNEGTGMGDESMLSPTGNLTPRISSTPNNGTIYVDEDGNSLYTRYADAPEDTSCDTTCMQNWTPLTTTVTTQGISGNFDVITRDDGSSQWTLLDYPLYRFLGDAAPGDLGGDNFESEWALARPIPTSSGDIDGDEALVALGSTLTDGNGTIRSDRDGHTLYFFDNDTAGASNCNAGCATNWPPLFADLGAQPDDDRYTLITRADNSLQWAYDGKALYFWQGDNAAGEFTGATVPGWNIARP